MRPRAFLSLLILALAGCSLDYEEAMVRETMAESIPDLVLENMQHIIVQDGQIVARLEAGRAVQYEKRKEMLLDDVHFRELDDSGSVLTEVWADSAVWHTDTEDAEATGDIYVYSFKREAEVFAQTLTWKKKERVLSAGEDEQVVMRKEDGSELRGTGFTADFRRGEVRMKAARGVYVYGEESEGAGEATAPESGGGDVPLP